MDLVLKARHAQWMRENDLRPLRKQQLGMFGEDAPPPKPAKKPKPEPEAKPKQLSMFGGGNDGRMEGQVSAFDENAHPRDDMGRWAGATGTGVGPRPEKERHWRHDPTGVSRFKAGAYSGSVAREGGKWQARSQHQGKSETTSHESRAEALATIETRHDIARGRQ